MPGESCNSQKNIKDITYENISSGNTRKRLLVLGGIAGGLLLLVMVWVCAVPPGTTGEVSTVQDMLGNAANRVRGNQVAFEYEILGPGGELIRHGRGYTSAAAWLYIEEPPARFRLVDSDARLVWQKLLPGGLPQPRTLPGDEIPPPKAIDWEQPQVLEELPIDPRLYVSVARAAASPEPTKGGADGLPPGWQIPVVLDRQKALVYFGPPWRRPSMPVMDILAVFEGQGQLVLDRNGMLRAGSLFTVIFRGDSPRLLVKFRMLDLDGRWSIQKPD